MEAGAGKQEQMMDVYPAFELHSIRLWSMLVWVGRADEHCAGVGCSKEKGHALPLVILLFHETYDVFAL